MKQTSSDDSDNSSRPADWLEHHGDALHAYAMLRLGSREVVEDIVQDTLLAGIKAWDRFDGKSTVRTWLISILKRKVIDYFRQQYARGRQQQLVDLTIDDWDQSTPQAEFFQKNGSWVSGVAKWPNEPAKLAENREFWEVFDECRRRLPTLLQAVFVLREMEQQSKSQICKELDISPTNLSVRLYRARLNLRRCLELNWFDREA